MKLSELVAYRNLLQKSLPQSVANSVDRLIDPVTSATMSQNTHWPDLGQQLNQARVDLLHQAEQYHAAVREVIGSLQKQIQAMESQYMVNSYKLYDEQLKRNRIDDRLDLILERNLKLSTDAQDIVANRIITKGDWHRPAMILRPLHEAWTKHLVACDPLYLVDERPDVLELAKSPFGTEYQRRIRCYNIDEDPEQDIFRVLPDEQFGFVLIYNYFHYRPFEVIRAYLTSLWKKLVPGGVVGFTFNDCDRPGAVALAENFYMCYTPGNLVYALVESLGYEIKEKIELDEAVTWIEIARPGSRPSLRGGQSLATIHELSKAVDDLGLNIYTSKQHRALLKQARKLGIDDIDTMSINMLEKIINERKTQ